MSGHLHGGRVYAAARRLGCGPSELLDFSANVNPAGPPAGVLKVFQEATPALLATYPDAEAPALRDLLAHLHGVAAPRVLLGHGGAALLFLALRALAPRNVLVPIPCFQEQPRAVTACGATWLPFPMARLQLDLSALEAELPTCDALLLTHPHNPTGQVLPADELVAWIARHPELALIVDEAFGDYAPDHALAARLWRRPRTVILRSLTKFYAMPGVRVGYAFADEATARRMDALQEGWPLGELDLRAAQAALEDCAYAASSLEAFQAESPRFRQALEGLGLVVHPSAAPFFLVQLPGSGQALSDWLETEGILIRTCAQWPGLDEHYVRFAIKSPQANHRLIEALGRWLTLTS